MSWGIVVPASIWPLRQWQRWLAGMLLLIVASAGGDGWIGSLDTRSPSEHRSFGRHLFRLDGPGGAWRLAIVDSWSEVERVWGCSGLPARPTAQFEAAAFGRGAVWLAQSVPDADGDGWSDLAGTQVDDRSDWNSLGRAVVVSSSNGRILWESTACIDRSGRSMGVAFGADLDRDGIPDPIVAEVTPARARSERLVLVSSVSGIALHSYPVTDVRRLRSIVDVNGDGTRDVLASAPAVELVLSGADLSLIQSVDVLTLTKPPNATDVAEIDGEFCLLGWIDLHCYETHEYEERLVCVSLESSTLRWEYSERGSDSSDSAVVTTCGDVDGDGVRDVLVGWPLFLSDAVHVHSGRNGALLRYDQRPFDHYGLAHFGTDVASLPDVDGDGVDDYATSDVQQGNQSPGRVHFVSGKTGAVLDSFGAVRLMSRGLAWL